MWAYLRGVAAVLQQGGRVLVERQWAAEHCRGTHLAQYRARGGCYAPSLARKAANRRPFSRRKGALWSARMGRFLLADCLLLSAWVCRGFPVVCIHGM